MAYSVCSCLGSANITSCAWARLWNNIKCVLVRFDIASLSSIYEFATDCSESAVIIWASISCTWFSETPYPWSVAVAFL